MDESVLTHRSSSASGVALTTARGEVLGVLVVLDREARGGAATSFDEEDRRFLASLASLAASAVEGSRLLRALSADVDRLREENRSLKASSGIDAVLVGDSAPMRRVKELISRAASSRASVLVRGESGTGKELAARLLHLGSPRRDGPFIAINCAAVPETLLESELFGIERGVATGVEARLGKFELASGGTIFLDEIADAPLPIQAKLLRALQEREIERVGGRHGISIDVRVVAATHADLIEEIGRKRFREDLYYRLRVVEVELPPLRDRREDVARLSAHFLSRIAAREGRRVPALSRDAVAALLRYPFPGNVRELENLLEGAAALVAGDTIEAADLQFGAAAPVEPKSLPADLRLDLASLEKEHIRQVLHSVGGNKARAARILGIHRRTLYRKHVN
jgi:Nif-specific regulatory protein